MLQSEAHSIATLLNLMMPAASTFNRCDPAANQSQAYDRAIYVICACNASILDQ